MKEKNKNLISKNKRKKANWKSNNVTCVWKCWYEIMQVRIGGVLERKFSSLDEFVLNFQQIPSLNCRALGLILILQIFKISSRFSTKSAHYRSGISTCIFCFPSQLIHEEKMWKFSWMRKKIYSFSRSKWINRKITENNRENDKEN